ncbi:MAG: hypothetical protein KBD64_05190 [Gammaproteobacteria bacterium]|nr:hypothetical protein [Gammaproteobacteria bacterium]
MSDIVHLHTSKSTGKLDEYLRSQVIAEAQKIISVYRITGFARTTGTKLFAENIIKLFSVPAVTTEPMAAESVAEESLTGETLENKLRKKFLMDIATAYTAATLLRTDKEGCAPQPFAATEIAGLTEDAHASFTKSLSYTGQLMQVALETYVFSKLSLARIKTLCRVPSTNKLDFSEPPGSIIFHDGEIVEEEWVALSARPFEERTGSTRLFHAFSTLLQTFPLSCDPAAIAAAKQAWEGEMGMWNVNVEAFDRLVDEYIASTPSLGDKTRYSQEGRDAITAREATPLETRVFSIVYPVLSHPLYQASAAAARSTLALRIAEAADSVVSGVARSRGIDSPTIGRTAGAAAFQRAAHIMGVEVSESDETQARTELAAAAGTAMVNAVVSWLSRCCTPSTPPTPPTPPTHSTLSTPPTPAPEVIDGSDLVSGSQDVSPSRASTPR